MSSRPTRLSTSTSGSADRHTRADRMDLLDGPASRSETCCERSRLSRTVPTRRRRNGRLRSAGLDEPCPPGPSRRGCDQVRDQPTPGPRDGLLQPNLPWPCQRQTSPRTSCPPRSGPGRRGGSYGRARDRSARRPRPLRPGNGATRERNRLACQPSHGQPGPNRRTIGGTLCFRQDVRTTIARCHCWRSSTSPVRERIPPSRLIISC